MDYGGLNAKIKAMKSRLLSYDDYYDLCLSRDIHEAGTKLRAHEDYGSIIDTLVGSGIKERQAYEQELYTALDHSLLKIHAYINDNNLKKYLTEMGRKREIKLIKQMLCSLFDNRESAAGREYVINPRVLSVDKQLLSKAESVLGFIDALEGSVYYKVLSNVYKEGISLFELELALDFYFYTNLWKAKNRYLSGINNKVGTMLVGTEIDMQNLVWISRIKTYYSKKSEYVYKYVMPVNYKLQAVNITHLAESGTNAAFAEAINETAYAGAFENISRVEDALYNTMFKVGRNAVSRYPNSIAVTLDYMYKKQLELRNIVSIFEGVRYLLEPDEIIKKLYVENRREEAGQYA